MATIILIVWYSALNDSRDVMVPAPAINGNASGTTAAVSGASSLYSWIPKIISSAIKKSINEPATANELTSIPIKFNISLPTKRKTIINMAATIDAFSL